MIRQLSSPPAETASWVVLGSSCWVRVERAEMVGGTDHFYLSSTHGSARVDRGRSFKLLAKSLNAPESVTRFAQNRVTAWERVNYN